MTSTHDLQAPGPGPGAVLARYWLPVLLVCAAHAGALAALWPREQAAVSPPQVMNVVMIAAAVPAAPLPPVKPLPKVEPPKPKPVLRPKPVLKEPAPTPPPQPVAAPAASAPPPLPAAPAPVEAAPVIVPPRVDASYRGNVAPPYPPASRRLGEEGTVVLRIFVNADGSVGEVVLSRSSGHGRLDQAALQAVKRWKLIPARRGSEPFATWYTLPFEFNLEK
jgi:protein TonB